MPDNTPEQASAGGAGRGSGGRRSGLDRLRAARGEPPTAATAEPTAEPTAGADETPTNGAGTGAGPAAGAGAGQTALLDTAPEKAAGSAGRATPDDDPAPPDATTEPAPRRRRRRAGPAPAEAVDVEKPDRKPVSLRGTAAARQFLVVAVLVLIVIALAIPVVEMRHRIYGQTKDEKSLSDLTAKRQQGLITAQQFAKTFFTFDYRKIDDYNKQILALSTGGFHSDFAGKQGQLKSVLSQVQSVATVQILEAGVNAVNGNNVVVFVVADQSIQNKASKGQTSTSRYRLSVTVTRTSAGWLTSDVSPVV